MVTPTGTEFNRDDLIYAAAFIDGEGCFELLGVPRKLCIRVKMHNSYRPVVEWFHEVFGGTFTECGVMSKRPMYSWGVNGQNAENFCRAVLPHLKQKKPQCQHLIDCRELGQFSWHNPPPESVVERRAELKLAIRELKEMHY